MADFKGSILELNNKHAIVMTDNCNFISIKRTPEMFLGQQLSFNRDLAKKRTKSYTKYIASAAAIFVFALFSIVYFQFITPAPVFAYIDLDINPSIEFSIDDKFDVIDVSPLNSDGQKIIEQLPLKNKPVKEAISEVIDISMQYGYISSTKENKVLVSASLKSSDSKKLYLEEKALSNVLSDIKTLSVDLGNKNLKPEIIRVTPEVRKAASENKISMGRYELYNKIKNQDNELTIEKAKVERVSDMLSKAEPEMGNKKDKPNKDKEIKPKDSQKPVENKDKKEEKQNQKHTDANPKQEPKLNTIDEEDKKVKAKANNEDKNPTPDEKAKVEKPHASNTPDSMDKKPSLDNAPKNQNDSKGSSQKKTNNPKEKESKNKKSEPRIKRTK